MLERKKRKTLSVFISYFLAARSHTLRIGTFPTRLNQATNAIPWTLYDSTVKLFAMSLQMKISKWTSLLLKASSCSFCIGSSSVLGFGRHANSYRLLLAESNRV
jgi:hypothetical protein